MSMHRRRIEMVTDEGTFEEWDHDLSGRKSSEIQRIRRKTANYRKRQGLKEAVVTGKAKIDGSETVIAVCDGRFLMASMGGLSEKRSPER